MWPDQVIRRTVALVLRIVRSSVDRRPIRISCDTDQKVVRSSVDGALISNVLTKKGWLTTWIIFYHGLHMIRLQMYFWLFSKTEANIFYKRSCL